MRRREYTQLAGKFLFFEWEDVIKKQVTCPNCGSILEAEGAQHLFAPYEQEEACPVCGQLILFHRYFFGIPRKWRITNVVQRAESPPPPPSVPGPIPIMPSWLERMPMWGKVGVVAIGGVATVVILTRLMKKVGL